jgi:hypothetical protein
MMIACNMRRRVEVVILENSPTKKSQLFNPSIPDGATTFNRAKTPLYTITTIASCINFQERREWRPKEKLPTKAKGKGKLQPRRKELARSSLRSRSTFAIFW